MHTYPGIIGTLIEVVVVLVVFTTTYSTDIIGDTLLFYHIHMYSIVKNHLSSVV